MHSILSIALCLTLLGCSDRQNQPLNFIIVLVDDLGWTDLSCQGSEYYETPNIDALAAGGVRFTDAYAACAVCSPTRAAVMTGRYPARTGVTDWIRGRFQRPGGQTPAANPSEYVGRPRHALLCPPNPFWLESEELTLAEILSENGYKTAHIGKWHLGDDAWYPEHQGFAENHGGCDYGQPPSYFDPYQNQRLPQGIPSLPPRQEGEYLTDREADEAVSFITRNKNEAFFLYLAHYAVHTPIQGKAELVQQYEAKTKTKQKNATYAAMLHSVDEALGRVRQALADNGVADRTVLIFTSDNGGLLGPTDNAPLRSGKGFPYEGGIRVPLIVHWPGMVEPGGISDLPVTSVDYFPTILELAGVDLPRDRELDGVSLSEHLKSGGSEKPARADLFWHFPHYRGGVIPYSMVRSGNFKLIKRYEGPTYELYDLATDLGEEKDLSANMPLKVQELDRLLVTHLTSVGAKLPVTNPAHATRKRVLILGDSISMGYTPRVQNQLADEAKVVRPTLPNGNAENCAGTTKGIENIDRWLDLDGGNWDLIHFNFGLHDLKRVNPENGSNSNDSTDPYQADPEEYERQLREIVGKLKASGAELVFATTTPVPEGEMRPFRAMQDPEIYNAVAQRVMTEEEIPVNDLYSFSLPRIAEIQQAANVHFTRDGSRALGDQVVASIRQALAKR